MLKKVFLLIAVLAGCNLLAQPGASEEEQFTLTDFLDQYKGQMVSRPRATVDSFEFVVETFRMDGFDGKYMELISDSMSLRGSVPNNWDHNPRLNGAYSVAWNNRYEPSVILSLSMLAKGDFIKTNDQMGVISYLAGLRQIHRERLSVNVMSAEAVEAEFSAYLMGQPSFILDYTIANADKSAGANSGVRHYTYLVPKDNLWLEIHLQGPTEKLGTFIDEFNRFVRNLSVKQEE
jgi:hypothetical protein